MGSITNNDHHEDSSTWNLSVNQGIFVLEPYSYWHDYSNHPGRKSSAHLFRIYKQLRNSLGDKITEISIFSTVFSLLGKYVFPLSPETPRWDAMPDATPVLRMVIAKGVNHPTQNSIELSMTFNYCNNVQAHLSGLLCPDWRDKNAARTRS